MEWKETGGSTEKSMHAQGEHANSTHISGGVQWKCYPLCPVGVQDAQA